MAGKRRREALADSPPSEEQVLAAVEARRQDILQHAATVSGRLLLGWLAADLGCAADELRRHAAAAKRRALELLEEQGQVPAAAGPASAADLPPEVLPAVLHWLDHDSLFCALQVSRAWRDAGAGALAGDLWQQLCAARGWALPPAGAGAAPAQAAPQQQQQGQQQQEQQNRQQQEQQQEQQEGLPQPDWRAVYRWHYGRGCYDCFEKTERHTLAAGSLRVRLCRSCSQGYDSPRPGQRLMTASTAKRQACLKEAELAPLPRCVEPNPVNPAFTPMHLHRRLDVRQAAVERWGSWEAAQEEHRRRITRG